MVDLKCIVKESGGFMPVHKVKGPPQSERSQRAIPMKTQHLEYFYFTRLFA